ncbi:MAG: glutamate-5-semialdehyde dehydrogenase [Rikenellaceae bacterium]
MLQQIFERSSKAKNALQFIDDHQKNSFLLRLADRLTDYADYIVAENSKDLANFTIDNPLYDRLLLTVDRVVAIANDLRSVALLESPLGRILDSFVRPNGMKIEKISVAFGVIGVVYEARPNVSVDVFSLCFKSGNVALLKGGSDAFNSNMAIVGIIRQFLKECGLCEDIVALLPTDRAATYELLKAVGKVDLIIPRGSRGLIDFVRENAVVPVIETGAGICHTYFDEFGDSEKGKNIVFNAKCRRVSVCNALDTLIIHKNRVADLPQICELLETKNVEIFADSLSFAALQGHYSAKLLKNATSDSFGTEFLDYKMSIKTVVSLAEAIEHIAKYSSKHSECIISENGENVALFTSCVDAACVYHNVSTAFTDGAQFGFGAEIGISTQKLHARGPMALSELTTYKYVISGDGQVRV